MIQRIEDYLIPPAVDLEIKELLKNCFPQYPENQSYLNQRPSFRYLKYDDEQLIAHLGVESRIISIEGKVCRVFGIVDLCVHEKFQSKKLASSLLKELEKFSKECNIDFILLFTTSSKFYEKLGFKQVHNKSRWLMIQKNQSLGVARRSVSDSLMVKAIGKKEWMPGEVDLMGHIF